MVEAPDVCPRCNSEQGEKRDRSEFIAIPPDREAEDKPEPLVPWWLWVVYAAHGMLGADERGVPTVAEQREWLDEYHVFDVDERRLWVLYWAAITAGQQEERGRKAAARQDDLEAAKRNR